MPRSSRIKPYSLSWPPTAYQWQGVDRMFQQLYKDLNEGAIGDVTIDISQLDLGDLTDGDLLYADGDGLSPLSDVATGQALLSQGVGIAPAYGQVNLTTTVTGTLPATNGGTGQASYTTGDLLYASNSTTLSKLADVATGNALISGGVGVAPSWGKIQLATAGSAVTGILPAGNGGTSVGTTAAGALLVGLNSSAWTTLGLTATTNAHLRNTGSNVGWSTTSWPNTATQGDIIYANAANAFVVLAKNASATRYLSNTGSSNNPAWAQVNLANGVSGTLPVANGGTGVATVATDNLLTGNGTSALTAESTLTYDGTTLTLGSGQIAFPSSQNASAGANTLDDYEEGTWTPEFQGSGGQSGQAYDIQAGYYVKVGQLVIAHCYIFLNTLGTITGTLRLGGLPFTVNNLTNGFSASPVAYFTALTTNWSSIGGFCTINTTYAAIFGVSGTQGIGITSLVQGDLSATTSMIITVAYRASA